MTPVLNRLARPLVLAILCLSLSSFLGFAMLRSSGQLQSDPKASNQSVGSGATKSASSAQPTAQQVQAEEYFKQGEAMVGTADENSDRQIALFQKALELNPDLTAAEFNLGVIYSRLRDAQQALVHFNRILDKAPATSSVAVNARYMAAINLKELGRTGEARERLRQLLAASPKHADALSLLGAIYLEEGNTDQAKALLEQAVIINPRLAEAFYSLAFISQKSGQTTEALNYYQKFVELMPADAAAQLNMAVLLAGEDRMQEAANYAQKATQLDPNNAEAWTELGKIQTLINKQSDAKASFRRSVRLRAQWSEAHRLLVDLLFDENKLTDADSVLEEALKASPGEAEIYSLTGAVATRTGDVLRALQSYGKAHELNPTAATAFDFAMAYTRSGMDPLAEEYFDKAVKLKPDFAEAWLNLGILRDRRQDATAALSAFRQAEVHGVQEGTLFYRMGLLYSRIQDPEKALSYLAKAIETDPPRWKATLQEDLKAVTSDLDSIRYKPEFQKLIE